MSSSQEDFEEDKVEIVRESLSDMDPGLLFAANHFVEDLLAKAQEEANRRQTSETEVTRNKDWGGLHSTKETFLLPTQQAQVSNPGFGEIFSL